MEREPPKSSHKMEVELDRISDLPEHIIEQILSQLRILDAARTCILSSKWRYRWAMLPNLYLISLSRRLSLEGSLVDNKLESIIDQVLLLHFGPVHKFRLREGSFLDDSAMDRWILHLTKGSIKDIYWRNYRKMGHYYRMPSCLFSCQSLINLELFYCSLKPPSSFKGFYNLKSLGLFHVNIAQDILENLVSSCPMLETLELMNVRVNSSNGFSHLNISSPSLRFFTYVGVLEGISFENTLFLAKVSITLLKSVTYSKNRACSNSSNLLKFLVHLPHIQRLLIDNCMLTYLAVGVKRGELLKPCVHLDYLAVEVNMNNWKECIVALCLLSIAPNLQELEIIIHHQNEEETNFWEEDCWNCQTFTKLQLVKITDVSGTKLELDFIKFILSNSPVLEKMTVKPASKNVELELFKKLLPLKRASVRAQIICLDCQL